MISKREGRQFVLYADSMLVDHHLLPKKVDLTENT